MMINFLGRSVVALLMAGSFAGIIHARNEAETCVELEGQQQRYTSYLPPLLLPICVAALMVIDLIFSRLSPAASPAVTFSACFSIFLHISVYYVLLTLLLPFFRRRISARACAMLWLLPNYLYFTYNSFMRLPEPALVLPLPNDLLRWVSILWAAGFVLVLAKHTITHLRYRRAILRDAREVTAPATLALWQRELEFAGMEKKRYRLVTSPAVNTPLSIGFFRRSIRVVLPERHYTPEELTLVLRHEIVHIGREDSATKFFLVFCTAMCWFNPLMWLAMKRSADDLELSCDETVLLGADDATRRQYADLLLRTAGDERGFTTCLSASAEALRYRLQNVVHPRTRRPGGLAVALVFYLLIMSCGYVALGYDQTSGQELIFAGHDPAAVTIEKVYREGDSSSTDWLFYKYNCTDEAALTEYLSSLNFCKVTGNYSFSGSEHGNGVTVNYATPDGRRSLDLEGNSLTLWVYSEEREVTTYFCTERLDWPLLYSLIVPYPRLDTTLNDPGSKDVLGRTLSSHAHILSTTSGGVTREYPSADPDKAARMYSSSPDFRSATFSFTHELYDGTFEVLVENWERTQSYTISSEELSKGFVLELPPYFAHYTIRATIVDDKGVVYDTEYRFDLGPMDSIS